MLNRPNQIILMPVENILKRILIIRGLKVMLDTDLARLYGVATWRLNEQVKRNRDRFPEDFMFQLNDEEFDCLRSQSAISNRGGRRYPPFAFTEHGVAMLSSVLHSKQAIQVNIHIMRAFSQLRQMLATHKDLARKLEELEKKYELHDVKFKEVFNAIRELMMPVEPKHRRRLGFRQS